MKLKGAEILVKTLISLGIDNVFGYPGSAVLDIYDSLYKNKKQIKHILCAHEQGACHGADGYARASGKVGVVIATSGPGATNLVTGIATAHLDSSPLLVITGNTSLSRIGTDSFQEVDTMDITMPITKHNYIVKDIKDLQKIVCEAYFIAKNGRTGPVLIDIPNDIQSQKYQYNEKLYEYTKHSFIPSQNELESAAQLINNSKFPLIYVGGGCISSGCSEKVKKLSELLYAPIGASLMGLSVVEHSFPLFLGITGMYEREITSKIKKSADLIIGLGVRFSDRAACNKNNYNKDVKILHIDIDPCEINKNIKSTVGIRSDIGKFLDMIMPQIENNKDKKQTRKQILDEFLNEKPKKKDITSLCPQLVINTLQKFCNDDTVIATDVGQHQLWTAKYFHFSKPRTFVTSGGLGTMGFGMGAAMGASLANNNKRTVLITGDGSFSMNCNELCTAVSYKLPLVIIIMNNNALGLVRQWQTHEYNKRYAYSTLNRKTDFCALAKAYGAKGKSVSNKQELESALNEAFNCNMPYVIDCKIDTQNEVLPMQIQ